MPDRRVTALLLAAALAMALCWTGCGAADAPEPDQGSSPGSGYTLDPARVPEALRHLVPLATRWGIGDDIERFEQMERASAAERDALAAAVAPHQAEITAWLDSFGSGEMSDEAAAFMYMQLAIDEMP